MHQNVLKFLVVVIMVSFCALGCAQKPETSSAKDAIQKSQNLQSVEAQAEYLIKDANAFVNSEQFDEAIQTAKHVLAELDKDSAEAQSIIQKAQAELKALAEQKAGELKEGMQKKLNELGQ